jgi:predicted dehydrogenase
MSVAKIVPLAAGVVSGLAAAYLYNQSNKESSKYSNQADSDGASSDVPSKPTDESNLMTHMVEHAHQTYNEEKMRKYVAQYEQGYETERPVRLIVVGAGSRGKVYSTYALEHPERAKVVAVCDILKYRREFLAQKHNVPADCVFTNWEDCAAREKFADAVIIATPDACHAEPAIAFSNKGYNLLVEKPMAVSEEDCVRMTKAVMDNNVIMAVGHVMRYTPYTQRIKQIVDNGLLGDIVSIQHLEPVGYWHAAHSYVRGNWRKEEESTFMLMAKSCHDVDWLRYIMGKKCLRVSSFGSQSHFNKSKKPKEVGDVKRCMDCSAQDTCPYSATTVYLRPAERGFKDWPLSVVATDGEPDVENITEALKTGPYGRCVYECDNDVVDNQVVNLEFEGGRTSSFSMVSFSQDICVRKTRIFGSHGQLECDGTNIIFHDFRGQGRTETIVCDPIPPTRMTGHSGADYYLMRNFVQAVAKKNSSLVLSGPLETLESHLIVFQAEKSRKEGKVYDIDLHEQNAALQGVA